MTSTFVLDTSVLLSAGKKALYSFGTNDVVIPFVVIKELENKKNDPEIGYPARSVLRALDELNDAGDLKVGVPLGEGFGTLRVEVNHVTDVPAELRNYPSNDTRIATVALNLKREDPNVVLVTKDFSLRIVASLVDVPTADFIPSDLSGDHIDSIETHYVDSEVIDEIHRTGGTRLDLNVPLNVPLELRSHTNDKHTALVLAQTEYIFRKVEAPKVSGVESHSREQAIAIDYLTDEDVKIVSLGGRAGTGKTTLALAAAVEQVEKGKFKKIIIFRSMHSVGGEELGFLPGTEQEKMDPWTKAIFDSLESFLTKGQIDKLKREQRIEVLPITHVRGRTFSNAFILVDESQNLERATLLTLLSRLGHGSKAALSWDVAQRDNHRVGRYDGIYEVVRRLLGEKLFGHVSLRKSERSEVAELVSRKLDDFN
jgi:PhoH-like ATPase